MKFTLREIFRSVILEANPTLPNNSVDALAWKYTQYLALRLAEEPHGKP